MTLTDTIKALPSYKKHSASWDDNLTSKFLDLLELYNQKGLDIYFRDPINKWEICVGRRECDSNRAEGIYIVFRFINNRIEYKLNYRSNSYSFTPNRGSLTEISLLKLNEFECLDNFLAEFNVTRTANTPKDYLNSETKYLDSFFSAMTTACKTERHDWYIGYQKVVSELSNIKNESEISDKLLLDLWYSRDNHISSLQQGALSKEEFESSKNILRSITKKVIDAQSYAIYSESIDLLQKLKDEGKVRCLHKALLNRVFSAINPQNFSTTVTKEAFEYICSYFTKKWGFKYKYSNWFDANIKLKEFIHANLGDDYDELLINIVLWVIYEEKHLSDLASRESDITLKTAIRKQVESIEIQFREAELERQFIQWLHNSEYHQYAISSQSEDLGRAHIRDVVLKCKETNTTLIAELKFKSNAKEDIEAAIGQLLRYALYPGTEGCNEIWIVGGNSPMAEDLIWFNTIKNYINLELRYFYKDSQSNLFLAA